MRTFFLLTPTIAALLCVLPGRMAAQDTTCEKYTTYSAECTSPCTPSSNVEVLEFDDGEGTDHPVQVPFSCKGPAGASCVKTIYVETPQPNPVCNCSPGARISRVVTVYTPVSPGSGSALMVRHLAGTRFR